MSGEDCSSWWSYGASCALKDGAKSVLGDAIANLANAVTEALGKAVASLGTIWVNIGTPNLTSTGQPGGDYSAIKAGTSSPPSSIAPREVRRLADELRALTTP